MKDYLYIELQTPLVLTPIICTVIGLVFALIYHTGLLLLSGLLFAIIYIFFTFLSVQQQYEPMLRIMPIARKQLTTLQLRFLLTVYLTYSFIFITLYVLYDVFQQQLVLSQLFAVLCIVLSCVVVATPLFLALYYTWSKALSYFFIALYFFFVVGGYRLLIQQLIAWSTTLTFHPLHAALLLLALLVSFSFYQLAIRQARQAF